MLSVIINRFSANLRCWGKYPYPFLDRNKIIGSRTMVLLTTVKTVWHDCVAQAWQCKM